MRIFINNCDGYVGNALCADLRVIEGVSNVIFGTLIGGKGVQVPPSVKRIVARTDNQALLKTITSCSVIVFDLHEQDLEEMEYALKALKLATFERPTTFILVSSVNVWSKSKKLYEAVPQDDAAEEGSDAPPDVPVAFKDTDFRKRVPGSTYLEWKTMETLVMALNSKENLKAFVVCAGVLYGNGESTFHDLFKASWQSKTEQFRIVGGENIIPTIHVRDLARVVKHIIMDPSISDTQEYIVAVDRGNKTQKEIVEGIVASVSDRTEHVEVITDPAEAIVAENVEVMTLDLRITPSSIMDSIRWWCEEGLDGEKLEMVAQEFCKWRKLKPIKIFAQGPPGTGLNSFLKELSAYYKIPIINVEEEIELWLEKNVPVEEDEGEAEATELYENIKAKWEEAKRKNAHLDGALVAPILIKRLESNVCRFRGYILDGYPDTFENTTNVFTEIEPSEGEEDAAAEKKKLRTSILPSYVLFFDSAEEKCRERALLNADVTEEEFDRKFAKYQKDTCPEDGGETVTSFFEETCLAFGEERKVFRIDADKLEEKGDVTELAFESFRIYLEQILKGKPYNYLEPVRKSTEALAEETTVSEAKHTEDEKRKEENEENVLERQQAKQKAKNAEMQAKLLGQEKQLLEQYSLPLRQYMATYVVPTLTEGLLEVCKVMPDDPVDYLAEYLFAHAQEVPGAPDIN